MSAPARTPVLSPLVLGMSIAQIVIAIPCICIQNVLIAKGSPLSAIGTGIWSGLFSAITGTVGIVYYQRETKTLAVAFLTLTVLSNASILALVILSTVEWTRLYQNAAGIEQEFVVLGLCMMLLGVGQAVVTIIAGASTCYSLCYCNNRRRSSVVKPGQVYYFTDYRGQQQAVVVPYVHQGAAAERPDSVVVPHSRQGTPSSTHMGAGPPVIMSPGAAIQPRSPSTSLPRPSNDEDSNMDETDMRSYHGFQRIKHQYLCTCGRSKAK